MEIRDKLQLATVVVALLGFLVLAHDRNFWLTSFKYHTDGLKCEPERCMLHVFIRNEGRTVEEGVEFELPGGLKHTSIYVDRSHEVVKRGGLTVLQLGLLHPGTKRHVAVFSQAGSTLTPLQARYLAIWSKARSAAYDGSWEDEPWWLSWLGWALVAYLALFIAAGIYFWFLETPENRKKRVQEQVEKLEKQIAALNATIAKRQMASK